MGGEIATLTPALSRYAWGMTHTPPRIRNEHWQREYGYGDYMRYETGAYRVCEYREIICQVEETFVGLDDELQPVEMTQFRLTVWRNGVESAEMYPTTDLLACRIDYLLDHEHGVAYDDGIGFAD